MGITYCDSFLLHLAVFFFTIFDYLSGCLYNRMMLSAVTTDQISSIKVDLLIVND